MCRKLIKPQKKSAITNANNLILVSAIETLVRTKFLIELIKFACRVSILNPLLLNLKILKFRVTKITHVCDAR